MDEVPSGVKYCLAEKRGSLVSILKSNCHWRMCTIPRTLENALPRCGRCDYRGEIGA